MVDNLIVAIMTAQANSMQILANCPMPQEEQEEFINGLSNLIALSMNISRGAFGLSDDQVMSILTLTIIRTIEIAGIND